MKKITQLTTMLVLSTMALAACNKPQTAAENRKDVAEQRAEGIEQVGQAVVEQQAHAATLAGDGKATPREIEEAIEKAYAVDKKTAEANQDIARTRCEMSTGRVKDSCIAEAKTVYDAAIGAAKAQRDAALKAIPDHDMSSN